MDINPQAVIDNLLEDITRLTLENAALKAAIAEFATPTEPEDDDTIKQ